MLSDDQWEALVDAAPSIAAAVAVVAGSTSQTNDELNAFLRLVAAAETESKGGLLAELMRRVEERARAGGFSPNWEVALPEGLQAARHAGALLSGVADAREADAVRQWLRKVAKTVAEAAREGGVMGIGSQQVSPEELNTMAQIDDALGVSVGE